MFRPAHGPRSILTLDVGGTKFSAAVIQQRRGQPPLMIRRESRPSDRNGGREWLLSQLASMLPALMRGTNVAACGVGFGGPVDFAAQAVALSTHVPGWSAFPLRDHLQQLLGVPAIIDNDANAGALGEASYGAGAGTGAAPAARPLFYLTLSTGIGGGIVLDPGTLYRGADSWAGEIGHITIRPDGPVCLCGARGCFERMCCGLWMEQDYGKPAQVLLQDPDFVRRYVVDVALGIKSAVMLLNPAIIVIGGGIAKAGNALFGPLGEELRRQVTPWSGARVHVVPAQLGDDSVLWGAYALAKGLSTIRTS